MISTNASSLYDWYISGETARLEPANRLRIKDAAWRVFIFAK